MPARPSITVQWTGEITPAVDRKLAKMNEGALARIDQLSARAAGYARGIAPVKTGNYRAGIGQRRRIVKGKVGVDVYSRAPHSALVEQGRKAGGKPPPIAVLSANLGISAHAAFLVGRKIAAKGTKGAKVMAKTKKALAGDVAAAQADLGRWLNDLDAP